MITKDYHGYYLEDALISAEQLIGQIRMAGKTEQVEFITGFGVIRTELFGLLVKYSLEPSYKLNNAGTITVTVE